MKAIVTTTIREPSKALLKFAQMKDWKLYVVGDLKTPEASYTNLNLKYLSVDYQEEHYPTISKVIGWNSIQRRNIGFIDAYRDGAEVVATVDDDNIPYNNWGENLSVGQTVDLDCFTNVGGVFDVLSITNVNHMWHRGYPLELLSQRCENVTSRAKAKVLVQVDLWDGDPDIDAICRIIYNKPIIAIDGNLPCTCTGMAIFDSQNTFLDRTVLPFYCVLPFVDRLDDIWGGIILQQCLKDMIPFVAFNSPSVYQDRNHHNFILDLEQELIGYKQTKLLIDKGISAINAKCADFFKLYQSYY